MAKVLCGGISNASDAANFALPFGPMETNATETLVRLNVRTAGTFSKLGGSVDGAGTGRTGQVRKNAANGAQLLTFTNSTANIQYDNSNTDSYAVNDTFCVKWASSVNPLFYWYKIVFEADTGKVGFFKTEGWGANGTFFLPLNGGPTQATETNAQCTMRSAGTIAKMCMYVTVGFGTSVSMRIRKNGANGNQTVSTASLTGQFEDTTNTDTFVSGDEINYTMTGSGGIGAEAFAGCQVTYTSDEYEVIGCFDNATSVSGSDRFIGIFGGAAQATESLVKLRHGFGISATRLRAFVRTAWTGAGTLALRKNGADANNTIALASGTTGQFEDTTHSDSFADTDDMNLVLRGGTSGTLNIPVIMLLEEQVANDGSASLALSSSFIADAFVSNTAVLPLSSSLTANTKQLFAASSTWALSSSLLSNTIQAFAGKATLALSSSFFADLYIKNTAVLNCTSSVLVDARVYKSTSAVLPCNSSISAITTPSGSNAQLDLTSSLSAFASLRKPANATLSCASSLTANVTTQYFAAEALLPTAGSVLLNTIIYLKASAQLDTTSALMAVAVRPHSASALLAASSTLQVSTIQKFVGRATLNLTGSFLTAFGIKVPADSVIVASSSVIAKADRYTLATASLPVNSSLAANILRYVPASSAWSASSALLANVLRYVPATAVLPSVSTLSASSKVAFAASATLSCTATWIASALRFTPVLSTWPLSSVISATAILRLPAFANLPGASTLASDIFILQNKIVATLAGTASILVQAIQLWKTQSSLAPTSSLSSFTLQKWNSIARLSPTLSFNALTLQTMLEKSKWTLTSSWNAGSAAYHVTHFDDFVLVSHFRADTVIDRVDHPAEGHYSFHGNVERKTGTSQFAPSKRLRGGSKVKHVHNG